MGTGCSISTNAGVGDCGRRPPSPGVIAVGSRRRNTPAKLKMPSSDAPQLPRNGHRAIRSLSNPAFARSNTVSTFKSGWRRTKRNLRATSEEITTVSESRTSRPNYNFMRERLLKWTPSSYHCRLFCGGPLCKYCDPNAFPTDFQAVPGLFSTWVTDDILATSRPTANAIKRFDLFNALKVQNIVSVINLQRPHEHTHCGPRFPSKLEFAYDPEDFMKHEFFHYNFGWPDFGASTVACLLDMIKVLEFAITQGKVAIHCHAGLGRTGVLICAFLMWNKNYTLAEAIQLVRNKRPGSVQTTPQVDLLVEFDDLLGSLKPIFDSSMTFEQQLKRQKQLLHGMEARLLKYIPKIVFVCCERLLEMAGLEQNGSLKQRLQRMLRCEDCGQLIGDTKFGHRCDPLPCVKRLSARDTTPERRRSYSNASTVALGLERPKKVTHPLVRFSTNELQSIDPNRLPPLTSPIIVERASLLVKGFDDDGSKSSECSYAESEKRKESYAPDSEKWRCVFDAVFTADASIPEDTVKLKIGLIEKSFSSRWDALTTETSSENLLFILRDWFVSLKEAAVSPDFAFDASNGRKQNLPKAVKCTILYCASVLNRISGNDSELKRRCAHYLAQCFTKQLSPNTLAENWFLATMECIGEMKEGIGDVKK